MKRLKVLHAIPDYGIAGAGKYLLTLVAQAEYRTQVEPVVCCPEGPLATRLRELGVDCYELPGTDRSFSTAAVVSMLRIIRRLRPDLVHTHASLSARIAACLRGVPLVFTKHTPDRSPTRLHGLLQKLLSSGAIAVSQHIAEVLVSQGYPPHRIRVIHNGVDPDEFYPLEHRHMTDKPARGELTIGTVGRLVPEKGHSVLVQAARDVVRRFPGCKFLIAGDGPERENLQRLIHSLGLEPWVRLVGYVTNVPAFLRELDLFVFPSIQEGLGIALIEAMMCGVPVVASRVGGIPEVIRDPALGTLVEPGNSQELAAAVCRVLEDQDRAKQAALMARQFALEHFNAARMAQSTVDFYRTLVQNNGPGEGA